MLKRTLLISGYLGLFICTAAMAQDPCATAARSKLYCLMPAAFPDSRY